MGAPVIDPAASARIIFQQTKMPFIGVPFSDDYLLNLWGHHPNGGHWRDAFKGKRLNLILFRSKATNHLSEKEISRMHHASHCRFTLSPVFRHFHDILNSLLHFAEYIQRKYNHDIATMPALGHQRFMITVQTCLKLLQDWEDPFEGRAIMKFPKLPQRRKSRFASNRVIVIEDRDRSPVRYTSSGLSLESAIIIE